MTSDPEILEYLNSIDQHLKVLVKVNFALLKMQVPMDDTENRAFELTGEMKRDEICTKVQISATTLSALWNRWYDAGLLVKDGNSYKKAVTKEDGI